MLNEPRVLRAIIQKKDIAPALHTANIDKMFESHKDAWTFVRDYYYKERAVPPVGVMKEKFPDIDIEKPSDGSVRHYVDQLRDEFKTVYLERINRGMSNAIGKVTNDELISTLQGYVSELTRVTSGIKDLDITDHKKATEYYTDTKRRMEENGGVLGIRSGYDSIDACYPTGFAGGQFIMIMSRTNQGKSWFGLDLGLNAWAQGYRVLVVSLEMSTHQVQNRAYTLMSKGQFNMSDLSRAQIDLDDLSKWTEANLKSDGSFVVTSSDGMGDFNPSQLQAKIDQYCPDIVLIDYLQLMSDNRGSNGETERIRNVSKELKSLAMSNDIPIIAIVSASSNDTKEYNKPPEIYEVASSRQAAFDADLVLSLFSVKQHDGSQRTDVCARKNRHGPLFDFVVKLDIENGSISEDWDDGESMLDDL